MDSKAGVQEKKLPFILSYTDKQAAFIAFLSFKGQIGEL